MMDLRGAGALVTGASGGIGQAVARALHQAGARVALSGRDEAALGRAAEGLEGAVTVPADLEAEEAPRRLADAVIAALGEVELLVSCAGIVRYQNVLDVSEKSLAEQLRANFEAPFMLSQRIARHLKERGAPGAIVHVASTLAFKTAPATAAYSASKAALVSATRSLALELAPHGIRVNAVAPGVIDTGMVRVPRPDAAGEVPTGAAAERQVLDQLEALREQSLLQRLGTPEDVADTVLYLLRADFVTGTVVAVDGGITLGPAGRPP